MIPAVTLLRHALLKKTAGNLKSLGLNVALPAAVGGGSALAADRAGGTGFEDIAAGIAGAGLASKPFRHIIRGGHSGSALRELDAAVKNPGAAQRWHPSTKRPGELEARGTKVTMDPTRAGSVEGARADLADAASKTRWGGGSLAILGKAGLGAAAMAPRLAGDVKDTVSNVAAATAGMKPGEENENNIRTDVGGTVTNVYQDPKTGQQVVQYTAPNGEVRYHTGAPGMKLAPDLAVGSKLNPKQSVFWAQGLGSNLTRAGSNVAGAAEQIQGGAKALREGAETGAGLARDVQGLVEPTKQALTGVSDLAGTMKTELPKATAALTTAGTGVGDASGALKSLSDKVGSGVDAVTARVNDPKTQETIQGVSNAARTVNKGATSVSDFLKSDAAKYVGLGAAGLGLAYLLSKAFSGKKRRDD
ncbi:MAG TPA: hypothetical protein PLS53_00195 [Thermoanaerobaculaceae bacterium]|mgnify:CR=1 FL=1|nr:hypothetical protein [Thermoanaerobaculaceae bacterium]